MHRLIFDWESTKTLPALFLAKEDFINADGVKFTNNLQSEPLLLYTPRFDIKFQVACLVMYTSQYLGDEDDQPTTSRYWMTEEDEIYEEDIRAWAYIPELNKIKEVWGE